MTEGDIVAFYGVSGRQLGKIINVPRKKETSVTVLADPGKGKAVLYQKVFLTRAEIRALDEHDDVQAARKRIKRAEDSGGGLDESNSHAVPDDRKHYEGDAGGRDGRGFPVGSQPPMVLSARSAHGGYCDWSGDFAKFLCGSKYQFAVNRLKAEYPQYHEVWKLSAELGCSMLEIGNLLDISESNARKRKFHAKAKLLGYFALWNSLPANSDDRVA